MKTYVVATVNFFDNEIKQSIQLAKDELQAFKSHIISLCKDDETKKEEIEWQQHELYPKTFKELDTTVSDWDMDVSVIEIKTSHL